MYLSLPGRSVTRSFPKGSQPATVGDATQRSQLPWQRAMAEDRYVQRRKAWRLETVKAQLEGHYANQTGQACAGCATYRDFRELLARDDIDAVMISSPDHWHVPMGIAAAKAGKQFCAEKPLSTSVAHAGGCCVRPRSVTALSRAPIANSGRFRRCGRPSNACETAVSGN